MERQYKDSGIKWIGQIPEDWNIERLKCLFSERNERDCKGRTLLSVSQYFGIRPKSETDLADSHIAESYDDYKVVYEGDFVMNIMLAWNGSYAVSDYDGMVSPAYCVFKFRKDFCKKYFHYLLRTDGYPSAFKTMSRGVIDSRLRLYPEQFYTFPVIIPSVDEQQRIADYLDKKCAEIDGLIELQEQMIVQLTDYKQSVITEAVTKGINPDAQLVPSGIDWIGDVPNDWKVCKLKNAYKLLNGRAYLDPELLENGKYRILRVGNLFSSDKWYYSDMELEENKYCDSGDLLYGWSASIGPYIWTEERVIYHYHIWKVLFGKNDLHYSYYLLQALTMAKQRDMHGSAMQHLTKINMDNSKIVIPPLSEQQAIASYLNSKCSEIDNLIAVKQQKIETLNDYKKSIIFESVTGKKEID